MMVIHFEDTMSGIKLTLCKDGRHVTTSVYCTKLNQNYSCYNRCCLVQGTSFGVRVCAVVHSTHTAA